MAQIRADEISRVLREEIENYEGSIDISETGSVISVGDGIARVYGLEKVLAGGALGVSPGGGRSPLKPAKEQGGTGPLRGVAPPHASNRVEQHGPRPCVA